MKIKKKLWGGGSVRGGGTGWGWGGVRVDVNEELKSCEKKKMGGGPGGVRLGVRVDVNEELKFL